MTNFTAPLVTVKPAPWMGAGHVSYTVQWAESHWMCGVMPTEVWEVWEAAGLPANPEEAGLVWEGGEYGNYAIA